MTVETHTPSEQSDFEDLFGDLNAANHEKDRGLRIQNALQVISESAFNIFNKGAREERANQRELRQAEKFTAWEARKEAKQAYKDETTAMDNAWKEQNRAEREARPERARARREARRQRWQERKELLSVTVLAAKTAASDIGSATLDAVKAARTMINEHKEQS